MADDDWDNEDGMPGIELFANAIQVWSVMQKREKVTVAHASAAFKVKASAVIEAVNWHPWMFLTGSDDDHQTMYIEHEGE